MHKFQWKHFFMIVIAVALVLLGIQCSKQQPSGQVTVHVKATVLK